MNNNTTDTRVIIPQDPVIGNFDEENIIDNDLNMHDFEIKNLKLSTDPNSATSNQSLWHHEYFQDNLTLTTDKLIVNNSLDFGANYLPRSSKVPTRNDDLTNKNYVDNKVIGNNNFNDDTINGSRLVNGSVSNAKITIDAISTSKIADAQITTEKLADLAVTSTKIADGLVATQKLADSSVTTTKIANAQITTAKLGNQSVTDEKISDVNWDKITNIPISFPSKTSTLAVDSDISLGTNYMTTTNTNFTNANQLVNKNYVDNKVASIQPGTSIAPLTISAVNVSGTNQGSIRNVVTQSTTVYEYVSQTGGTILLNDEAANVRYVREGSLLLISVN